MIYLITPVTIDIEPDGYGKKYLVLFTHPLELKK